jgi:hypothetical protein
MPKSKVQRDSKGNESALLVSKVSEHAEKNGGLWTVTGPLSEATTRPQLEKIQANYRAKFKTTPRGEEAVLNTGGFFSDNYNAFGPFKRIYNAGLAFFTKYDERHREPTIKEVSGKVELNMMFKNKEDADTFLNVQENIPRDATTETAETAQVVTTHPEQTSKKTTTLSAPDEKNQKSIVDAYNKMFKTENSGADYQDKFGVPTSTDKGVALQFPDQDKMKEYFDELVAQGVKFTACNADGKVIASCAGGENATLEWNQGDELVVAPDGYKELPGTPEDSLQHPIENPGGNLEESLLSNTEQAGNNSQGDLRTENGSYTPPVLPDTPNGTESAADEKPQPDDDARHGGP